MIVRSSVLYGWHPTKLNFATWVLKALRERQRTKVAVDHINSPTLKDAGITEVAIIIGSIAPEKFQEFYGDGGKFGAGIR